MTIKVLEEVPQTPTALPLTQSDLEKMLELERRKGRSRLVEVSLII